MDLIARRLAEERITIAAAKGLVLAGCTVSVLEGEKVFVKDSTDPIAIYAALYASGEPCFQVKRVINGKELEGWVDFIGPDSDGIEVTADEHLRLHSALRTANDLAKRLVGSQQIAVGKVTE